MSQNKTIFDFKKSFWRRFSNRIDLVTRTAALLFFVIMGGSSPLILEGLRNTKIRDDKDIWIKTSVRNLENKEFSSLDEEDQPIPLKPRSAREQFKAEFSKIV